MNRTNIVLIILCLAGAAGAFWVYRGSLGATDRGMASLEFTIPPQYRVFRLGETDLPRACAKLLGVIDSEPLAAVEFTDQGSMIQLLVDSRGDLIDERGTGSQGTVKRVLWRGSVRERLAWGRDHASLEAPGLPPPDRRNPYH